MSKHKDSRGTLLKPGESERLHGPKYEYKYNYRGKRKSIYANTLAELRTKEQELNDKINKNLDINNRNTPLDSLFEMWKTTVPDLAVSTKQTYIEQYATHIKPAIGNHKVPEISRNTLRQFYGDLADEGLSRGTILMNHNIIHQLLRLAVEEKLIPDNPSDGVMRSASKKQVEQPQIRALTVLEERLFVSYLEQVKHHHEDVRWLFLILLKTGMRIGEALGLTWNDVDFVHHVIHVRRTLIYCETPDNDKKHFSVNPPKTYSSARDIPLTPEAEVYFVELYSWLAQHNRIGSVQIGDIDNFIFVHRSGKPYYITEVNRKLQSVVSRCNKLVLKNAADKSEENPVLLPRISAHSLRHTFGTRCIEAGMSVKTLQVILGHAKIQTTMDYYVHPTVEFKQSEMELLESYRRKNKINNDREDTTNLRQIPEDLQRLVATYVDPYSED